MIINTLFTRKRNKRERKKLEQAFNTIASNDTPIWFSLVNTLDMSGHGHSLHRPCQLTNYTKSPLNFTNIVFFCSLPFGPLSCLIFVHLYIVFVAVCESVSCVMSSILNFIKWFVHLKIFIGRTFYFHLIPIYCKIKD